MCLYYFLIASKLNSTIQLMLRYLYIRMATHAQSACSDSAQIEVFVQTMANLHPSTWRYSPWVRLVTRSSETRSINISLKIKVGSLKGKNQTLNLVFRDDLCNSKSRIIFFTEWKWSVICTFHGFYKCLCTYVNSYASLYVFLEKIPK